RIGSHVFTRDQVDGDQALLPKVYPQWCVDYGQNPPHLLPSCLQPFSINLTLGFNSNLSKAEIDGLPVKRFIRFAFLSDLPGDVAVKQFRTPCLPDAPFQISPL